MLTFPDDGIFVNDGCCIIIGGNGCSISILKQRTDNGNNYVQYNSLNGTWSPFDGCCKHAIFFSVRKDYKLSSIVRKNKKVYNRIVVLEIREKKTVVSLYYTYPDIIHILGDL
jgi:hypothetical protein